jgi:hypothetical protein
VIYALRPEAHSRVNAIFMGGMFAGGAIGSWFAGLAWRTGGWEPVAEPGAVMVLLALGVHGLGGLRGDPIVTLIAWLESERSFRYATVVQADGGICISAGTYSNLRVRP